jgi:signal transduction histidine kinase
MPMSCRVLLIEDNPGDADLIAELFDDADGAFTIVHAATLGDGIRRLADASFDIVLTDLGLPDALREEVVSQVRAHTDTTVVVLTGLQDERAALEALAAGAQDYLVKGSFDTQLLEHSLRHAIERNQILQASARAASEAELSRAEASAARAANEAKNQFLSRMSHELRTPLNAILGFGQLLQIELGETEHADAIGQILQGGHHLLHLINDVLDIVRIESGETSMSSEPIRVADVLDEALQLMAPLAEAREITLMAPITSADYLVLADRHRLRQILLNLLSNAIKYNRLGGKVWVEPRAGEHDVSITVHDDGAGISLDLQRRLFTPFDRLGAETSGVEGTGIGLSLTKSLAELMHGSLTVESTPGRGSGFTVTLPRAAAPWDTLAAEAEELSALGPSHYPPEHACTLLYIEDNAPNVEVVRHILKLRPQWQLVHTAVGHLGVELAAAQRPDLILLDLHLPDSSGAEVLTHLKSEPGTRDLPVVILSADGTGGQAGRLLETGAAAYLSKPLIVKDLLAVLDDTAKAGRMSRK